MSVLGFLKPTVVSDVPENYFVVVHPLDDAPEQKMETASLGAMPMTTTVKISLMALRGYLILMMLMVLYHVMDLGGAFGHAQ
jgi:hypothetical protein